jgi:single-strand DNA-binding protein
MYHQLVLAGHLGRDPEMRFTPSGAKVTTFPVAINDDYVNAAGEKIKRTIWVRVSVFGNAAEACNNYLAKGKKVLVVGTLNGDKNGNPTVFQRDDKSYGASFEMKAAKVRFLSDADSTATDQPGHVQEEDLPF